MTLEEFLEQTMGDFVHCFKLENSVLALEGVETEDFNFVTTSGDLWSLEGYKREETLFDGQTSGRCNYQLFLNSEFVSEVDESW